MKKLFLIIFSFITLFMLFILFFFYSKESSAQNQSQNACVSANFLIWESGIWPGKNVIPRTSADSFTLGASNLTVDQFGLTAPGFIKATKFCLGNDCITAWPSGGAATGTFSGVKDFYVYVCENGWFKKPSKGNGDCFDYGRAFYFKDTAPPEVKCRLHCNNATYNYAIYKNPSSCPSGYYHYQSFCEGNCDGDDAAMTICRKD